MALRWRGRLRARRRVCSCGMLTVSSGEEEGCMAGHGPLRGKSTSHRSASELPTCHISIYGLDLSRPIRNLGVSPDVITPFLFRGHMKRIKGHLPFPSLRAFGHRLPPPSSGHLPVILLLLAQRNRSRQVGWWNDATTRSTTSDNGNKSRIHFYTLDTSSPAPPSTRPPPLLTCNLPLQPLPVLWAPTATTTTQTNTSSSTTAYPSAAIAASAVLMLPIAPSAEPVSLPSSLLFISAIFVHLQCLHYHTPCINVSCPTHPFCLNTLPYTTPHHTPHHSSPPPPHPSIVEEPCTAN